MINQLSLQAKVLAARRQKGWDQERLSKISGVSQPVISRIENGGDCKISTLEKLQSALGILLW